MDTIKTPRVQSVDLLRGAVMILMAIDHVRVYSGIPAGGPTPGIFFTRWITHFCAPTFAFFAGTSAFLYFMKTQSVRDVSKFLVTRGLLLVVLELTLIRFFWTFNLDFASFTLAGVIWMLGWCMVILAAFVRLKPQTIGIIGLIIILIQQIFFFVPTLVPGETQGQVAKVWSFFYPSALSSEMGPPFGISVLYVLIPWIGVMMAGYGFGQILLKSPESRNKICLRIGLSAIALFLIIGSAMILSRAPGENDPQFIFKLLNQQKYPASQLYLLMTLGPVIALVPWAEKVSGAVADAVKVIGRVPMFYYLMHILVIHISALGVNLMVSGTTHQDWYGSAPFVGVEEGQRWNLPLLYLVWAIDVVILYILSRWYARYKYAHPEIGWMKYI